MSTVNKFDWLSADQLKAELPRGAVIGREIIVLEQTSSTNDAVSRVASTGGLPSRLEGLVVFAEHQTAGRGRRGNHWESTAGKGLWFSILLRPEIPLSNSGRLTIWAMEAISDVIRSEFGLEPAIKLPNDVQLDEHKLAGVLVEMRAQDKAPHLAVVGIGINVNQCRDDFPAELQDNPISLAMALGREVALQNFALALLRKLDLTYREKFSKQA
ncbi:MAG: biotin--[acetyl-CoA-carboxylase] ligase [Verrucomicrobia bacterium]|nr:MAG: biotin--[acetyl-CoA-carboxylase] ligase [Verrucomicrobiota bacterium]